MKKKFKIGTIAITLSMVMFAQSMPMNLMTALAEEIVDVLTAEEEIKREFYTGNMVDVDNITSGYIVQENIKRRTLTSKEF